VTRLPHARRGFSAGFTLIELMTVVVLIGIVSGLGIAYLGNFKRRGNFATATGDLQVALRMAKAEAYNRGTSVVFIVDTAGGKYYVVEDVVNGINIATTAFNPNALPSTVTPPVNDKMIMQGTFPSTVSFASAPPTNYATALPAPYASLPVTNGCTFCNSSGTNAGFGSITFAIGSGAVFSNPTAPPSAGGTMTIASSGQTTVANQMIFAIVGRTGTFETFEVFQ
jgi:prepilin-type N-terminal cleavage/methylation domain-containing protein